MSFNCLIYLSRTIRSVNFDSKGRESINSLEDTLLRNSRSGFTEGSVSATNKTQNAKATNSLNTFNGHMASAKLSSNSKNSHTNISNGLGSNHNSHSNMMDSTDTLSRNQRETLHSRFDFIRILGKGTYGKVKLANDKRTGKQVDWNFFSKLHLLSHSSSNFRKESNLENISFCLLSLRSCFY
jgi:hypothetical protein